MGGSTGNQQGGFLTSFNEVGVITGAVREGDERIEQAPVPIHGPPARCKSDL